MSTQKEGPPWKTVGVFDSHQEADQKRQELQTKKGFDVKIKKKARGFVVKIREKGARGVLANAQEGREA